MTNFENFKLMQYFYRPNGNVEFRPFHENNTVDNEQRENKNVLQKSDDTHSHKQSEYKHSEGSTENMNHTNTSNDNDNASLKIATNTGVSIQNPEISAQNTNLVGHLKRNTLSLAKRLFNIYKNQSIVKKIENIIDLLKFKNVRFKLAISSKKVVLVFDNVKLDIKLIVKVILGRENKIFRHFMSTYKGFNYFVNLFRKQELKHLGLLKRSNNKK